MPPCSSVHFLLKRSLQNYLLKRSLFVKALTSKFVLKRSLFVKASTSEFNLSKTDVENDDLDELQKRCSESSENILAKEITLTDF